MILTFIDIDKSVYYYLQIAERIYINALNLPGQCTQQNSTCTIVRHSM